MRHLGTTQLNKPMTVIRTLGNASRPVLNAVAMFCLSGIRGNTLKYEQSDILLGETECVGSPLYWSLRLSPCWAARSDSKDSGSTPSPRIHFFVSISLERDIYILRTPYSFRVELERSVLNRSVDA